MRRKLAFAIALALGTAALAQASAPPVGPLPEGPVTTIRVEHGLLFSIALPKPASGLTWRGARQSDATVARPLEEGELNGKIVFTYLAGRPGTTTVVYALTRGEGPVALQARYFKVVVFFARCSSSPSVAAKYVIPPPPFVARLVSVHRQALPATDTRRLYRVTFFAVHGNAVLPTGHRYTQFAYVARKTPTARWCFVGGGSGP